MVQKTELELKEENMISITNFLILSIAFFIFQYIIHQVKRYQMSLFGTDKLSQKERICIVHKGYSCIFWQSVMASKMA